MLARTSWTRDPTPLARPAAWSAPRWRPRARRPARVPSVVGEQAAQERLAARPDQQRDGRARAARRGPRSSSQLCSRGLGEAEPRVEHEPLRGDPGGERRLDPLGQLVADGRHHAARAVVRRELLHVVAVRAPVHRDVRHAVRRPRRRRISGSAQAAGDVVDDARRRPRSAASATSARMVSTETAAPSAASALDHRDHAAELLGHAAAGWRRGGWTRRRRRAGRRPRPAARGRARSRSVVGPAPPSENESGVTLTTPISRGRPEPGRPSSAVPWAQRAAVDQRHGLGAGGGVVHLPRTAEVMVRAPALRTPRIVMQRCSASITTITPRGLEDLHQRVGDLGGQPLLHLRALGVDVDQPGQLGQAGDLAALGRDVADVGDAGERHQVVLAHRPELDVVDQDHLVVADVERGGEHVLAASAGARRSARRTPARPGPGCRAGPRARGPRRSRSSSSRTAASARGWSNAGSDAGSRSGSSIGSVTDEDHRWGHRDRACPDPRPAAGRTAAAGARSSGPGRRPGGPCRDGTSGRRASGGTVDRGLGLPALLLALLLVAGGLVGHRRDRRRARRSGEPVQAGRTGRRRSGAKTSATSSLSSVSRSISATTSASSTSRFSTRMSKASWWASAMNPLTSSSTSAATSSQ